MGVARQQRARQHQKLLVRRSRLQRESKIDDREDIEEDELEGSPSKKRTSDVAFSKVVRLEGYSTDGNSDRDDREEA